MNSLVQPPAAATAAGAASRGATGQPTQQYLLFTLGDETFALDIRPVREIIQFSALTVVPLMPDFVRGVINLRGAVVPVIDLQSRFGRRRAEMGKKTSIIIFDVGPPSDRVEMGVLVDAVSKVVDLGAADIEPPPQFGATIAREFIHGLGKVESEFIVILEPERTLNIDDMVALTERHHVH